jgi:excisionase family DNA binding protein
MNTEKEFLTTEEVADRLSVSIRSVKTWLKNGDLPSFRKGRLVRIRQEDFDQFVKDHTSPPQGG